MGRVAKDTVLFLHDRERIHVDTKVLDSARDIVSKDVVPSEHGVFFT